MTGAMQPVDPVASAARRFPHRVAILFPGGALSYRDLERYVRGTARAIEASAGGPRVGLVPGRTWKSIVLLLALLRARRVTCLLSARWPSSAVERAAQQVSASPLIACTEAIDGLVQQDRGGKPVEATLALDAPATIVYTTGATGEPKAALHSFGNHLHSARGANAVIPLRPKDRWLLSLPMYHVGGLGIVVRCLIAGATIVVPPPEESAGIQLRTFRCTHASLVATQLLRLLREDERAAPPSLKAVVVGGSSVPQNVVQEAHGRDYPVCTTYGLTEMTSQVTTLFPGASPTLLATAGAVLPHREVRIAPDGEIHVRGPVLFQGYVNEDGVHRPLDQDGWFATGDLGYFDADGFLYVEGRKDNMFISGGENIAPEAIERALCAIGGVERAVVVPVPDEIFGARPVAFVAGNSRWAHLARELEKTLPQFMVPAFRAWPALTPHRGMKEDRAALQKLAQSGPNGPL